jgi:hypothetical protein
MRKAYQSGSIILFISMAFFSMVSCNKEISSTQSPVSTGNTTSSSAPIVVAADSSGTDSVYILQSCPSGFFRDSVAAATLPDSVTSYLNNNYPGYGFLKAFVIKNIAGTVGGYIVIATYNGKPVGLLFDNAGNFERVLEQRDPGDLQGDGHHGGRHFGNRDGQHRDTVSLADLPAVITSYLASDDPSDTLLRAYRNQDSSYLVISKDDGLFATLFSSTGSFIKRVSLWSAALPVNQPDRIWQNIVQDSLPSGDLNDLTKTYPNYVFETAYSLSVNNLLTAYVVFIDANDTKYAVWFDASGNMIATLAIW